MGFIFEKQHLNDIPKILYGDIIRKRSYPTAHSYKLIF